MCYATKTRINMMTNEQLGHPESVSLTDKEVEALRLLSTYHDAEQIVVEYFDEIHTYILPTNEVHGNIPTAIHRSNVHA